MANSSNTGNGFGIPGLQPRKPDPFQLQRPNPFALQNPALSLSANTPLHCPLDACCREENIIIIGSELEYNSFWAKMMFMACGYGVARGTRIPPGYSRAVNLTSILVIDYGYTELERQRITTTRYGKAVADNVVMITGQKQLDAFFANRNKNGATYKIKHVVVFSHGLPGKIDLNYKGRFLKIDATFINKLNSEMFAENAIFFSYACRTGVGTEDNWLPDNLGWNDLKADKSLAQYIANKLQIKVRAFYRRTLYSGVMRDQSQNKQIAASLKSNRSDQHQDVINLSGEHEALFHSGLAGGMGNYIKSWLGRGPVAEGENDYALWRKWGAVNLPTHASDPEGFPTDFATFEPKS